jgi:DNA-binding NarL/FixJ family response regulator
MTSNPDSSPSNPPSHSLRVLFVDDETRILDGLRRALRAHRDAWDMRFAATGAAAIAEMERSPADLVITDMRMPEMDGVVLLTIIRARWPQAVRVVLSGQTDADAGLAAVRIAHQFLNKPCEHGAIVATIERVVRLTTLLPDARQRAIAAGLSSLASRPCSRAALERILADPQAGAAAVLPVFASDAALAARILQLSSSAFFVRTHPFTDLEAAIGCLGIDPLRTLAASQAFTAESGWAGEDWLEAHHAQAVCEARAAREATGERAVGGPDYLCGLFSSLSALVAASSTDARASGAPASPLLGAWLLGIWGVAWPLVERVARESLARGSVPDTMGDAGDLAA